MRSIEPGLYEHELDGIAKYVYYRNGAQGEAYYSLIGERPQRLVAALQRRQAPDAGRRLPAHGLRAGLGLLHERPHPHVAGQRQVQPWQRELYGFYLAVLQRVLKAIARQDRRPGHPEDGGGDGPDPRRGEVLEAVAPKAAEDFVTRYKRRRERVSLLGHWVGMATHDVGSHGARSSRAWSSPSSRRSRAGREDLHPPRGHDHHHGERRRGRLERRPVGIDAIEKLMTEEGMLEKYPRVYPPPGKYRG